MAKKGVTRRMMVGTEGREDYLVAARKGGFILGVKPLYMQNLDTGGFGIRIRLEQDNKPDIQSKADEKALLAVFSDIPWSKRSPERFSTVLTKEISFGIDYPEESLKAVDKQIDDLLATVEKCFGDDEKWINRSDLVAFLKEGYTEQQGILLKGYEEFKAANKPKPKSKKNGKGKGDVVDFPSPTTDI